MARGALTQDIKDEAFKFFGYEITQQELRLLPYLQSVMMNDQRLDPRRINEDEREILSKWRKLGYLDGGASEMTITKEFWDVMHEILWLGYVNHDYGD